MKRFRWAIGLGILVFLSACTPGGQETPLTPTGLVPSVEQSPVSPPTSTALATSTPQPTATATVTPTTIPTASATSAASPTATARSPLASATVAKFFQLAWSPSGERIAITTKTGLYLFDANDLSRVILNETAYPLRYLAFSPDGRQLATTNGNNYQIWDGITGQLIHDQFFSSNGIPGLGYDQAGNLYIADLGATGTSIDVIRLLGQETRWLASVSYAPVPFVVISPAGDTFAVPAGGIEIWAMAYRQEPLRTLGESQEVEYIYSPDGKHIAAAGINCQIQIFDVATGQTLQTITWCEQRPKSHRGLAFSLDGKRLAANNGAGALLIWDVGTGELLQTIPVAVSQTSGLAFSPDGKRLAAIGDDNTVRLWEVQP